MKKMACEFAIPGAVPAGKYAGARIADLPTEDLDFVAREHCRNPAVTRILQNELRRRKKRSARRVPLPIALARPLFQ
jgi:uncharacterized protein (DUF3820 family)